MLDRFYMVFAIFKVLTKGLNLTFLQKYLDVINMAVIHKVFFTLVNLKILSAK